MPRMIRCLAAVLALGMALSATARAAAPRDIVQEMTDAALKVLDDRNADTETKRHKLEDIVYDRLDWDTITKLVLARNLTKFTPEQKDEFTRLFKEHLSLTYGRSIESYNNDKVTITGDHQESDGDWTVKSKILRSGGADDVMVDYRLRKVGDGWKIIDIVAERVSLVSNFRSQFQELVSQGGPQKVLAVLREKNAKREPLKEKS